MSSIETFQREVYDRHYAGREALTPEQVAHPLFADFYDTLAAKVLDVARAQHGVRVFEAACGEGLLAAALQRVAARRGIALEYTGTDVSAAAVRIAATVAPGTYLAGDAADTAATFPAGSFDIVVAKNLLHHLEEPAMFLAAAGRAIADGGAVVAVEATRGSPQAWLFSVLAPRRERLFFASGRERNRRAFARAGLQLVAEEPLSWLPYELAFAIRFGIARRLSAGAGPTVRRRVARLDASLARMFPSTASYRIYVGRRGESPSPANPFLEPLLLRHGRAGVVLDLGCGRGFWLQRMVGGGLDAIGVEVDAAAAKHAARHAPVVVASGMALPLGNDSVSVVWCAHVLHHDVDPIAVLREARRVLAPGGRLLLAETVDDSPLVRLARTVHPAWDGVPVRSRYTADQLEAMVAAAGFGIVEQRRHGAIALLAWLLPFGQLRMWQRLRRVEDRLGVDLRRWAAHVEVVAQ